MAIAMIVVVGFMSCALMAIVSSQPFVAGPQPQPPSQLPDSPAASTAHVQSAQFLSQNDLGEYQYGYVSGDGQAKNEVRGEDGTVSGAYTYLLPSGVPIKVFYSAGPNGFRASGSHLPQPVPLPEVNVRAEADHMVAKRIVAERQARRRRLKALSNRPAESSASASATSFYNY